MTRPAATSIVLAILLVTAPATLLAQAPVERAALSRFRDSLRTRFDVRALTALRDTLMRPLGDRGIKHLRLGYVDLRLAELDSFRFHLVDAEAAFGDVVRRHADWPFAWVGRGLARLNLSDDERSVHTVMHLLTGDDGADAADDIARSGIIDSSCTDGLVEAAYIALIYRHPGKIRAALLAFGQVAGKPVMHNADMELARARLERVAGSPDTAHAIVDALLAARPDDPVLLMEAGHLHMMLGEPDGPALWFRGLVLADSDAAALYRSDLVLLFPDATLQRFDATGGTARAMVVELALAGDDSSHLRTAADRLREHYRRLDRAREQFARPFTDYHADSVAFRPNGLEMDERGLVWVLHGTPGDRTMLTLSAVAPNESWRYTRPEGGEYLFHFLKTDWHVGYHRVASLMDIIASSAAGRMAHLSDVAAQTAKGIPVETRGAGWLAQTSQELLYSRESTSHVYSQMLTHGGNGAAALQSAERATGDTSLALGETWTVGYELPLDATAEAIAPGTDAVGATLQVVFGIAGASLYAPPITRPVVYPVRMRVRVVRGSTLVAAVDTLRNFVASEPVADNGTLFGRLPLRVPPGEYQVFIALETPSRGVVLPPQTVRVAAPTSPTIDMSDLAIGARSVRLPWSTAKGDTAWVNPLHEFTRREPMQLYFEVFGVPAGGGYKASLAIFKARGARPEIQLAFNATAAGSPDAVHREIDLGRLGAGSYELQVTVVSASSQNVIRRREFTIVK
jgi:hypothetical protein